MSVIRLVKVLPFSWNIIYWKVVLEVLHLVFVCVVRFKDNLSIVSTNMLGVFDGFHKRFAQNRTPFLRDLSSYKTLSWQNLPSCLSWVMRFIQKYYVWNWWKFEDGRLVKNFVYLTLNEPQNNVFYHLCQTK